MYIDDEIEESMKPPLGWMLSVKCDYSTWEEQLEESRQLNYVEKKEDYDRELEDGLHGQMRAYEHNLQSLQGQVIKLRSQIKIEVEKSERILRNAKAHEKYLLAQHEENMRAKDEELEEKYRVHKGQVRHLETKLENMNEKLASLEGARQVVEAERDDLPKQLTNLREGLNADNLKQIRCLEGNIVKFFPPASPQFEEQDDGGNSEVESAPTNEALGEERMDFYDDNEKIDNGDYLNIHLVREEINNLVAEETKEGKPLCTKGPNIYGEYNYYDNDSNGKERIEEVGKAEQISLAPVPKEINSKPSMAIKTEDDKPKLTIKPLPILFYSDDDSLQRWTIKSAAWTMKPADKGGGIDKRDWAKKWSRFLKAVT
uniref:Ezrin/radixin/moesin family n=2 Tax=Musca domestica TaxID=7370 RepID=T1PDN0_MUSDO